MLMNDSQLERLNLKIPAEIKEYLTIAAAKASIAERRNISLTEYFCDLVRSDMEKNPNWREALKTPPESLEKIALDLLEKYRDAQYQALTHTEPEGSFWFKFLEDQVDFYKQKIEEASKSDK